MQIGSGCTVHLRADELPSGRLVVSVSRHLTAVIDCVITILALQVGVKGDVSTDIGNLERLRIRVTTENQT